MDPAVFRAGRMTLAFLPRSGLTRGQGTGDRSLERELLNPSIIQWAPFPVRSIEVFPGL